MTTFYLIRHGESRLNLAAGGNLKGAERGWSAHIIPLTEKGINQIEECFKVPVNGRSSDYYLVSNVTGAPIGCYTQPIT